MTGCEPNIYDDAFYAHNKHELLDFRNMLEDEESKKAFDFAVHQKRTFCCYKPFSYAKQYFDRDIIKFSADEVFVDCGAFTGDTIIEFIDSLKKQNINAYKKIYAFECDGKNIKKMKETIANENIAIIERGCWSEKTVLRFADGNGANSQLGNVGETLVAVDTIDNIVLNDVVTFIKMEIEGSELEALKGAKNTISKFKPKLAICVYHKKDDMILIPKYIKSLNSDYKFYLRNYSSNGCEIVLYAI